MLRYSLSAVVFITSCLSCISKDDFTDPFIPDDNSTNEGETVCEPWNKLGFDLLGLLHPNNDINAIQRLLPPNTFIGLLDGSFGTDTTHLQTLLDSDRIAAVRVHLLNTVCLRSGNCGPSDNLTFGISPGSFTQSIRIRDERYATYIRSRVSAYKALSNRYPCVRFFISPMLEHDEDRSTFDTLAEWVRSEFPGVAIVNTPNSGARETSADLLECHGAAFSGECKAGSLDGFSIRRLTAIERTQWREQTVGRSFVLSWFPEANCRPADGRFIPIAERMNCVTFDLFKELLLLTYD